MSQDLAVQVSGVDKSYENGTVKALQNINLSVPRRSFLALAGPSGSGKTTLLNVIGTLDIPDSGSIVIDSRNLKNLDEKERTRFRREKIGFVFQQFNLVPVLTARENIELPLEILPGYTVKSKRDAAMEMLKLVGLEGMANRLPNQLSGGQQQRVAVARALVKRPPIVLADEPTANLDGETGIAVVELMKKMRDEFDTSFIFSTHDPRVIDRSETLIMMSDGRIEG